MTVLPSTMSLYASEPPAPARKRYVSVFAAMYFML